VPQPIGAGQIGHMAMRIEIIGDATLYLGDCMDILPTLGKVDAVVTDPPYGIKEHGGKVRFGPRSASRGFSSHKYYEYRGWDNDAVSGEVIRYIIDISPISIVWGANHFISRMPFDSSAWLVWHKKGSDKSSFADCELAWTNLPQAVRYFKHDWVGFGAINSGVKRDHPTQKPVPLMKWCLGFIPDSQTILDPFMGSGTTGIAALDLGRKFIGIEKDEKYFDIACKRIDDSLKQGKLFQ